MPNGNGVPYGYRDTKQGSELTTLTTRSKTGSGHNKKAMRRELTLTARLGGPLALGELGWMSTYIVDAIMVGRLPHSALAISASSLGNTIYYAIVFGVIYLMFGMEVLVAQAYGRGDREDCVHTLAQSMWFVVIGTPLVMGASLGALPLLRMLGTSAEIVGETSHYMHALVWSTAPLLLYMLLRRYLQSISRVVLVTVSLVTANVVNLVGDWAFLYGHLGSHAMGIAGSGWATCIVRVYMMGLVMAGVLVSAKQEQIKLRWGMMRPDFERLRILMKIGWPAAVESFTDLGFSTYMSVVCARLGTTLLAAHQVVLDLDAFIYMVPLGIAGAAIVRVGQTAGTGSVAAVRRSGKASVILAMGFITVASLLFAGFPRLWAGVYTNDSSVIAAAAPIFLICGILQLGDAANVIYGYALYGLGDTRTPFYVNTVLFWVIGMPLSYYLAFYTDLSLMGLWIGRMVAALATGVVLAVAWYARLRRSETGARINLSFLQPMGAD